MSKKHLGQRLLVPLFVGGAFLGMLGSWLTYDESLQHHREEFVHRAQVLAGAIAGLVNATEAGSQGGFANLRIAVEEFAALEPSVLEVIIATSDPFVILVSTAHSGVSDDQTLQHSLGDLRRAVDDGVFGYHFEHDNFDHGGVLTAMTPMRPLDLEIGEVIEPVKTVPLHDGGSDMTYAKSDYRGVILLRLDWASVQQNSAHLLWHGTAINLITVGLLLALFYLLIQRMVLTPMATIRKTLRKQEEHQTESRVPALVEDEIGNVADTLNHLLDAIEERDQRLKRSHEELGVKVDERTRELREATAELVRRERLATLGQLSSTVSHELRNPLGTIRNSLFTIMRRTQDSEIDVEQALERANNAIQRCNTIIADLLDYASDKDLAMQLGHIDDWLSTVLGDMQIPDTVELKSDFASNAEINFSPDAMQQVVINLVENACQAMTDEPRADGSSAVIEITTRIDGDSVVIMFTDSGPGIAPDARERIFEPLYSTKSFGVGLGLPLVKKIVEQHGGSIEIDPSVGTGAKFTLRFPLVNTEQRVAS